MRIGEFQSHPAADVFPLLEGHDFEALCADIRQHGLLHPIVRVVDGADVYVLDGRNRLRACIREGVTPRWVDYPGGDPYAYVISENLRRRHLDESQRAQAAARLHMLRRKARTTGGGGSGGGGERSANLPLPPTQAELAEQFNVSERSIRTSTRLIEKVEAGKASPEWLTLIERGAVTASAALPVSKRPLPEQEAIIIDIQSGERLPVVLRKHRLKDAQQQLARAGAAARAGGVYDVLVLDPPWTKGGAATLDGLRKLELPAAPAAHLWLWTPAEHIEDGFALLRQWGFDFVCPFVWHKQDGLQPPGMPRYNCLIALYARRGDAAFSGDVTAAQTCFKAPAGRRGAKPAAFYKLVRQLTENAARRLDLFAPKGHDDFEADPQAA